jgi:hypothetical protein
MYDGFEIFTQQLVKMHYNAKFSKRSANVFTFNLEDSYLALSSCSKNIYFNP